MNGIKPGAYSHYTWSEPEARYRIWLPSLDDYIASSEKPYVEVTGALGTEHGTLTVARNGRRALVMAPGTWHHVEIIEED